MEILQLDPRSLTPAPWNPNKASPEDQLKLDSSLVRFGGMFKPVVVRTLPDGTLQLLGGHWRTDSAIRLGLPLIPVVNLGEIDDQKAKEITLVDNGRYGHDDAGLLADLLRDLGNPVDLAAFMPYDLVTLDAITATTTIDLDSLGLDEDEAPAPDRAAKTGKTHQMVRALVSVEDAEWFARIIKQVQAARGFTESDQLTNAGDALVSILREWEVS